MFAFTLECGDHVHRLKRPREIRCDAVEERLAAGEAVGLLRTFHAQDPEHIVADTERYRDGLARVGIHTVEAFVGDASSQHDLLPARRDPPGYSLVEALAAPQLDLPRETHGCAQPQLVALDEHDRRRAGPHPARHFGRGASQHGARVASVHQTLADPAEHIQALVQLCGAPLRTNQVPAVGCHHREELRG